MAPSCEFVLRIMFSKSRCDGSEGVTSELIFTSCGYDILASGSYTTLDGSLSLKIPIVGPQQQSSFERVQEECDIDFTNRCRRQVTIYPNLLLCFNDRRAARDWGKRELLSNGLARPMLTRISSSRVASNRECGLEPSSAPLARCKVRHPDTQLSQRFCGRSACKSLWYTRGLRALLGRS